MPRPLFPNTAFALSSLVSFRAVNKFVFPIILLFFLSASTRSWLSFRARVASFVYFVNSSNTRCKLFTYKRKDHIVNMVWINLLLGLCPTTPLLFPKAAIYDDFQPGGRRHRHRVPTFFQYFFASRRRGFFWLQGKVRRICCLFRRGFCLLG